MKNKNRIVVIGGSAAGPKAAARARRLDQGAEIRIIQREPDLSMASCGYPYYVEGVVENRRKLLSTGSGIIRDPIYYWNTKGIIASVETEVTDINREDKVIVCRNLVTNETYTLGYDKLVIATGSSPVIPDIPGKNLAGITTLKSMRDADVLRRIKDEGRTEQAVVIGGGPIGLEICEALQSANIKVILVEAMPQILPFLDRQLAEILGNYLKSKAVDIITGSHVVRFEGNNNLLTGVMLSDGTRLSCELSVLSVGVRPNADIARSAGLAIGPTGGIVVNRYMQTSDQDVYAAGDCTEQHNLITNGAIYAPLGDLANLEGRVAGENAVMGNTAVFPGVVHSSVCKVFEYTVGSTGLSEARAHEAGQSNLMSVVVAGTDKPGFMKGQLLVSKTVVDTQSRKIIGFQCVGPGNVSKQVAQAGMAIQAQMALRILFALTFPMRRRLHLPSITSSSVPT